jgi:hypothetical protein
MVRGSLPGRIRMRIGGCPAPPARILGPSRRMSSLMRRGHPLQGWLSSGGSATSSGPRFSTVAGQTPGRRGVRDLSGIGRVRLEVQIATRPDRRPVARWVRTRGAGGLEGWREPSGRATGRSRIATGHSWNGPIAEGIFRCWLRVGGGSAAQVGEIDPSSASARHERGQPRRGWLIEGMHPKHRRSPSGGPPSASGGSFPKTMDPRLGSLEGLLPWLPWAGCP